MARDYIRVFQELDIEDIKNHLILWGDLTSDCASCRMLGIDISTAQNCPQCNTQFKYVTSRRLENQSGERFHLAKRMREKRPDLLFIDYTDYTKILGQKKARDFFA